MASSDEDSDNDCPRADPAVNEALLDEMVGLRNSLSVLQRRYSEDVSQ